MSRILVIGGAGFIGSHLIDKLVKQGQNVIVLDNLSTGRLQNLAQKAGIDWSPVSTKGISELWKWQLKCIACKKIFPTPESPNQKKSDWGECTDCGTQLKLTKRK